MGRRIRSDLLFPVELRNLQELINVSFSCLDSVQAIVGTVFLRKVNLVQKSAGSIDYVLHT